MKARMMVLMCVAMMIMAGVGWGAVLYNEGFNAPDDTVPTDWTIRSGIVQVQDNTLHVGPLESGDPSSNRAKYDGQGSSDWDDYTVNFDWMTTRNLATSSSSSLYPGFYVHASENSIDSTKLVGYLLRLRDTSYSSSCRLYISKEIPGAIHDLAYVTMSSWSVYAWYNMNIIVETKPDMTVSIDVVMSSVADGEVIGTVSAVDDGSKGGDPFYSGTIGVAGIFSTPSYYVRYDNLVVNSDPNDCASAIASGYGFQGDMDANCRVDLLDFALLTQDWDRCMDPVDPLCEEPWGQDPVPTDCANAIVSGYTIQGDLNTDCYVGLEDLATMAQGWARCMYPDDPECETPWD